MLKSDVTVLNNGVEIPVVGLGVWQMDDADICKAAVEEAINIGYRLIDTASAYLNEEYVGAAIKSSGIPREQLFITTKLWVQDYGYEQTKTAFKKSLKRLQLDYLDMYLMHWPVGDYISSWKTMESLYSDGLIRAIGVCNFPIDALKNLLESATVVPVVDQVETHPFYQQKDLKAFLKEHNIHHEAWGPLLQGKLNKYTNPLLESIALKYKKSIPQVILRWHVQEHSIVIPKSVHKNRLIENIDVFDFKLTEDEMSDISRLDADKPLSVSPNDPKWLEKVINWKFDI